MLIREIKFQAFKLKTHFPAFQSLSLLSTLPHTEPLNDTVNRISTLIKTPNWQKNHHLKSLVSHMNPLLVSSIIASQSHDTLLSLNFFKWVCKQSTYCYDIDSRIQLLYLLVSDNLYTIVHKVMVFMIQDCCSSEADILKLIYAIADIRKKTGFRINYPCYSTLLMCLMKLDMGLMTCMVFKSMVEDEFVVGEVDYRTLVNALCKNGYVQAAEMFVSRVLKLGFMLDVYICTSMVLGNYRACDISEAYKVFELMSKEDGCGVNRATYSILVHGLCEVGRLDEACKLMEDMRMKGCKPSVRTYTVLIKAMCNKGLSNNAFSLFEEMIKKGCKPNFYTYTIMVDMLCREGKIDEANGMFQKMLKDGMNPNTVSYNALINGYCKEGRLVSSFELLGMMERMNCKPNIRTYNELMHGLCKIFKPFKALTLLGKVIQNGLFPTGVTFNILIDGFCKAGQVNMAFKILLSMKSNGIDPDQFSYASLIDSLCKMEKPDQASVLLGKMVKKGISVDEVTLTAFIHGYCRIGKIKYGLSLFEGMVKDRHVTSPHTFNIFLDIFSKEVNLVQTNAVFGKMIKYGLIPSVVTYTTLIDGFYRAGDTKSCFKMLETMKEFGCDPNIYTYTIMINGFCRDGKVEEAENLFLEMQKDGISPNDIIYGLLIKSHVINGRLLSAFEIMSTMLRNDCKPSPQTYISLLAGILYAESSERAEFCVKYCPGLIFKEMDICHADQLREKIEACNGHSIDFYSFLVSGLSRVGRISDADNLIKEMVKNGLSPDNEVCDSIVDYFCENHNYDLCFEWIVRFYYYGCIPSLASIMNVIAVLQNVGKFQEAEWLKSNILRDAGFEDQTAILPYIEFLLKGEEEEPFHDERPLI